MSRQERLEGVRKLKLEDISFESEVHNIYDPFFSSQSSGSFSYGSESEDDSETSSDEEDSAAYENSSKGYDSSY